MSNRDKAEELIKEWTLKHLPAQPDDGTNAAGSNSNPEPYPKLTLYTYPENHKSFKGKIKIKNCIKIEIYSAMPVTDYIVFIT